MLKRLLPVLAVSLIIFIAAPQPAQAQDVLVRPDGALPVGSGVIVVPPPPANSLQHELLKKPDSTPNNDSAEATSPLPAVLPSAANIDPATLLLEQAISGTAQQTDKVMTAPTAKVAAPVTGEAGVAVSVVPAPQNIFAPATKAAATATNQQVSAVSPVATPTAAVTPAFKTTLRIVPGLEEPLVNTAATSAEEDAALDAAITAYKQQAAQLGTASSPTDFADLAKPLEAFLAKHPQSGWAMALQTNMGLGYYHAGYFTRAFAAWEAAWQLGKSTQILEAKRLTDRAVGELARMHARVGHAEALEKLFAEMGDRKVTGAATEFITGAKEGLWSFRHDYGIAYLCGPKALVNVLRTLKATPEQIIVADEARSGPKGFNLTQVSQLADKVGLGHKLIYRKPGQAVPVPSVINWKVNHYAAIVAKVGDRYLVQDPTFASGDLLMSEAAIDVEGSGYFLIPETVAMGGNSALSLGTSGWREVTSGSDEANAVFGMGNTGNNNSSMQPQDITIRACPSTPEPGVALDPATKSAMCVANAHQAVVSLTISDTAVGVNASRGPAVQIALVYNQREQTPLANYTYSNVGQKWTFNWLEVIQDNPVVGRGYEGWQVTRFPAGGGIVPQPYYNGGYTSSTGLFQQEQQGGMVLKRVPGLGPATSYELTLKNGGKRIYETNNGAVTYPRIWFLTRIVDPQGNEVKLNYDKYTGTFTPPGGSVVTDCRAGCIRLISVTDAVGGVTTFSYTHPVSPLLVTQITDPFGRSAILTYDTQGRQESITDPAQIKSLFTYDASGLVTSMTTPYGLSSFAFGQPSGTTRWLELTDPLGATERLEYKDLATGILYQDPVSAVPQGMVPAGNKLRNSYLNYRNTFYWDRLVYPKAITKSGGTVTAQDFTQAYLIHWLHGPGSRENAPVPESVKPPLESRIWYTYTGQRPLSDGYYNTFTGLSSDPVGTGRVLDDGTTKLEQATYNLTTPDFPAPYTSVANNGKILSRTDAYRDVTNTNITGRTTRFTYDTATNVDLTKIEQKTAEPNTYSVIATATYDTKHNPTSVTGPDGQVWKTAYNTAGQIIYQTNPLNQTSFREYDCKGRLMRVTVPVATGRTHESLANTAPIYSTDASGTGVTGSPNKNAATAVSYVYPKSTSGGYNYPSNEPGTCTEATVTPLPCTGMTVVPTPDTRNTNLPLAVTDSEGRKVCYEYDKLDRVTKKFYPDNTTELTSYAFPANLNTVPTWTTGAVPTAGSLSLDVWQTTDRLGRVSTYKYDRNRRKIAETETFSDRAFVADAGNNRVMVYDASLIGNGESAINVLGQSSFTTSAAAATQSGLNAPRGVAYDSVNNRLFVADAGNNRVLVYDVANITNGKNATNVLGQSSFTGATAAITQAGMNAPEELAYDSVNNRLFVADTGNNRVLVYDVASITDGENAVNVLGQSSFTTNVAATTQLGMNAPRGIVLDSATNRLFVSGSGNNRVTVYDVATITNGENAVNALGQSSFTASAAATTAAGLSGPRGLAYDSGGKRLFVAGNTNNRVTVYDVAAITNGESAINVLGQSSFTTSAAATTAAGLSAPTDLAYDGEKSLLYVTGANNNRVTVYDVASITNGEVAVNVLGQSNLTTGTAAITATGLSAPRGLTYERATRTTSYEYYANGALQNLIDANGTITHWERDIQSRPTSKTYDWCRPPAVPACRPTSKTESYTYENAISRLKTITDPDGRVKTITYNADDSVAGYSYTAPVGLPPTPNVTFKYDAFFPRLTSMTDGSGPNGTTAITDFEYTALEENGALQLQRENNRGFYNHITGFFYDELGRLAQRWAAESQEWFLYDTLGRVSVYGTDIGNFNYGYLGNTGQVVSQSVTNGSTTVTRNWSYDTNANDRRLLSINNGPVSRSFTLNYAAPGIGPAQTDVYNIRSIIETAPTPGHPFSSQTWKYTYDSADRLLAAVGSVKGTYQYDYDKVDNVTRAQNAAGFTDFPAYDQLNRMSKFAYWQNFAFDGAGNTLKEYNENGPVTGTLRNYKWDFEGRLIEMTDPRNPGYRVFYTYDGMGRRLSVGVTSNGTTFIRRLVWCGMRLCQERDLGLNSIRRYLHTGEYVNALNGNPAQKLIYMQDQLGSVRDIVDADTGARVGAYDYDPYGTTISEVGPANTSYRYGGLFWDGNIGQYLSVTRQYDPGTLRWLNRDWIREAGGINLYAYSSNPISNVDPMGTAVIPMPAIILPIAVVGGAWWWWQNVIMPTLPGYAGASPGTISTPGAVLNEEAKPSKEQCFPDNPGNAKDKFKNIKGTPAKENIEDGSVWEKDWSGHGGEQWKRWPDRKKWEKAEPPNSVWPDGSIRK